ncbi:hypothetical protein ACEQ8H_002204 [Pleosporales sp. CAS-2024a]
MISTRKDDAPPVHYVNPTVQLNVGLWTLFAGASVFLALRIWVKITRRHGIWYDDHILIATWMLLAVNNSIITLQFATGYVTQTWDNRMHILITITSCGTLIGQALSKTAFAVTLLKLTRNWAHSAYSWVLWFCIVSMNTYMMAKVVAQWGKVCGSESYDVSWRLDFCMVPKTRDAFKEGGNVYNVIMDFILAAFPWVLTWKLEMRKSEKIGLCITMSLGMFVAIIAAIRINWKDAGNQKDAWYFWRNAHSNIWYSSEIVGTIIVQCIPVLRPLLCNIHTSLTSKKLPSVVAVDNLNHYRHGHASSKRPPTFGSGGNRAHIYSDARWTNHGDDKEDDGPDSWDNRGIFQKTEFELTTLDVDREKEKEKDKKDTAATLV